MVRTPGNQALDPRVERELAYLLLVELLAYQFASPVKWIETQNVLLKELGIKNLVEIGPTNTLINLAKRTLKNKEYQRHDATLGLDRKLLSYSHNAVDINHGLTLSSELVDVSGKETETKGTEPANPQTSSNFSQDKKQLTTTVTLRSPPPLPGPVATTIAVTNAMVDVPVTAQDITLAIISQKLQRPIEGDDLKKSIKHLCGGRSTLENEIIGDLEAEFSTAPEQADTMELRKLIDNLQSSFSEHLNKVATTMISKMISIRMPGGFRTPQIQAYLRHRWGLGPGRQDSILLRASAQPPPSRLSTQSEAESFFDNTVEAYLKENNLTVAAPATPIGLASDTALAAIEPVDLVVPTQARKAAKLSKLDVQARLLGVDLHAGDKALLASEKQFLSLQKEMDSLTAELGDVVIAGVQPKWSVSKIRKFDSYWNWALQDLIRMFGSITRGEDSITDPIFLHKFDLMVNRSCVRLIKVAQYLERRILAGALPAPDSAKTYLSRVINDSMLHIAHPTINPFAKHVLKNSMGPRTIINAKGDIVYEEMPRLSSEPYHGFSLKTKIGSTWVDEEDLTRTYKRLIERLSLGSLTVDDATFSGKVILLVGAGAASIGSEILRGLLAGGANVIVATSNFSKDTVDSFQEIYMSFGARGSQLRVVPFNQASRQDLNSLVSWIYDPVKGLGLNIDHVYPFAAISENGRQLDELDSKSELAHRMMMVNVLRLVGAVKKEKSERRLGNHITQVILPLSPNHGVFGSDGLYAESKIGLETLFTKWHSESWGSYISICGASIGWTRSTGLMEGNDVVAEGMEKLGMRTFSTSEMALYVLLLSSSPIAQLNETVPIYADLTGGMKDFDDLKSIVTKLRSDLKQESSVRKDVIEDEKFDIEIPSISDEKKQDTFQPKANMKLEFPPLLDYDTHIQPLTPHLEGMVDLDRVVVATGLGEIGPYGNARTRWEFEANGKFSLEGCIEMAWMMGMIKHFSGEISGKYYNGWVDAKTRHPIQDNEVRSKYEKQILDHTGIRLVEPQPEIGYGDDATKRQLLQEIVLTEDMAPLLMSKEMAEHFENKHGDLVDVYHNRPDNEDMSVRFKKGATILVPKAIKVEHAVAGQIPMGWDPKVYGFSDDIISQVDRVTLYTLVAVSEALLASGITDPYEFYKHIHITEIGNCIGSGLGAAGALKKIFQSRYHDLDVQVDILQEVFINTTAAWVNMLLMSSAGPLRTPVGACATALESLESAFELIASGKSKVCLVGGFDDLSQAISVEFANMGATSDPIKERKQGRLPKEASRPATSSRAGFVESHGSGIQILTTARLALDMGLPIQGIIAWAGVGSDKVGRSIPAPGKGVLANASEETAKFPSPLLNIAYRRRRLQMRLEQIEEWTNIELECLKQEAGTNITNVSLTGYELPPFEERKNWILQEAAQQQREARATFGHQFWHGNPQISPIRGSLAVWGLTINDLDFASLHGTSTSANDLNETEIIQQQLSKLGRDEGNILFCIFQKYLTGHSKGAAAAWMLNGCFQAMNSGLIPGQANADNIDFSLRDREFLFYPKQSLQTQSLKAFSVTSFGFGQKGAQAIGIHAKYLFALLSKEDYELYCSKAKTRAKKATQFFGGALATNSLFTAKSSPPWQAGSEHDALLNPGSRF